MSDPEVRWDSREQGRSHELPAGVPLFVLAAVLFVGAYLLGTGLLVVNTGRLHIWSLLLLAGLVAAIGGTVAFFFTEEGPTLNEEILVSSASTPRGGNAQRDQELGRPRPEVRVLAPPEEPWREAWPEDEISERPSRAPSSGAPVISDSPKSTIPDSSASSPGHALPTPAPPASISSVVSRTKIRTKLDAALAELEAVGSELDEIERETSSHRKPTKPAV